MTPVETLDRLVSLAKDGEKRYHHAALDVGKEYLEEFFNKQSAERKRFADELFQWRQRLAGDGKEHGSIAGTLETAAMDFSVVMSKGDTGIVEWCKEDAEKAIKEYRAALNQPLPPELKQLINQHIGVVEKTVSALQSVLSEYGGPRS
jgi:uncharacterized protein (TIGR02284 family)